MKRTSAVINLEVLVELYRVKLILRSYLVSECSNPAIGHLTPWGINPQSHTSPAIKAVSCTNRTSPFFTVASDDGVDAVQPLFW